MEIFLLLGWVELELLILTVIFWFEMDDEKLIKNEIGLWKFFIAWLGRA